MFESVRQKRFYKTVKTHLENDFGKMGEIVEQEGIFTLYISQKYIDEMKEQMINFYQISFGFFDQKKAAPFPHRYDNFPHQVVFDGLNFSSPASIDVRCGNIVIKNCTFNSGLSIYNGDNVTLENNIYYHHLWFKKPFGGGPHFNYTILNQGINESFDTIGDDNLDFLVEDSREWYSGRYGSTSINFIDSRFHVDTAQIFAKEVSLNHSEITSNNIYIHADSMKDNHSKLEANQGIIIENINNDFHGDVDAPIIFYNDISIETTRGSIKENEEIVSARQRLLQILKEVSNYCNKETVKKVYAYEQSVKSTEIGKMLKK